jgi:hypothetical protein
MSSFVHNRAISHHCAIKSVIATSCLSKDCDARRFLVFVKWLVSHAYSSISSTEFFSATNQQVIQKPLAWLRQVWLPVDHESDVETMLCPPAILRKTSVGAETLLSDERNDA